MNEGRTANMIQRRALPDSMNLLPLACGISDETARIKAIRLMNELMLFNDPESWFMGLRSLGFHENASGTKRWRAILRLPTVQKDVIGFWLDRKKRNMERPDARRTSCVLLVKLFADELVRTTSCGQEHAEERGLYLGCLALPRPAIIYPERAQSRQSHQESTIVFMKITFHSLQRLFQRGYGLSEEGGISYERLLKCLFDVWLAGKILFGQTPEETRVIVPFAGLRFVLARNTCINGEAPLDLITVLPPQK